jgi:hypothetical protein
MGAARADFISGFPQAPGGSESPTVLDLTSSYLETKYDGAGLFTVESTWTGATSLNNDSIHPLYDLSGDGNLDISLTIDPTTGAPLSGTLTISGDASNHYTGGTNTGNLLTGTISQFGFPSASQGPANDGAEVFEFIFNTTGGDLAAYYPSIVVNLSEVDIKFNGTFGTNIFDDATEENGQTDTYAGAVAPEPPTLVIFWCLGGLFLLARFVILGGTRMLRGSPLAGC